MVDVSLLIVAICNVAVAVIQLITAIVDSRNRKKPSLRQTKKG